MCAGIWVVVGCPIKAIVQPTLVCTVKIPAKESYFSRNTTHTEVPVKEAPAPRQVKKLGNAPSRWCYAIFHHIWYHSYCLCSASIEKPLDVARYFCELFGGICSKCEVQE